MKDGHGEIQTACELSIVKAMLQAGKVRITTSALAGADALELGFGQEPHVDMALLVKIVRMSEEERDLFGGHVISHHGGGNARLPMLLSVQNWLAES